MKIPPHKIMIEKFLPFFVRYFSTKFYAPNEVQCLIYACSFTNIHPDYSREPGSVKGEL